MATLNSAARAELSAIWQRLNGEPCSITKADLRAAVNALDDFMNTNAATINLAIPLPARSALTASQKARLLVLVVERRWIDGA